MEKTIMSDTEKDQEFYDLANSFIELANQQASGIDKGKVSAAFLYAAARFNTFVVASSAANVEQFMSYKEKAYDYMVGEYQKMLEEHFGDYRDHFKDYIKTHSN
jgi:hypothetical protein